MTKGVPAISLRSRAYRWMGRFARRHPKAAKAIRISGAAVAAGAGTLADLSLSYWAPRGSLAVTVPAFLAAEEVLAHRISRNIHIEEKKMLQNKLEARVDDMLSAAGMRYEVIDRLEPGEQANIVVVREHKKRGEPARILKTHRILKVPLLERAIRKQKMEDFFARIEAEAASLEALKGEKNNNIVEFHWKEYLDLSEYNYYTGEEITSEEMKGIENIPCFIMEFARGETLAEELAKREGMGFRTTTAIKIMLNLTSVLKSMKNKGVIHRDLKPANIKVADLEKGDIKVYDFGIARDEIGSGTIDGAVLGTLNYMAPEQMGRGDQVSWKSDLYAAGVILWEMLTCELPYQGIERHTAMPRIKGKLQGHPDNLAMDLRMIDTQGDLKARQISLIKIQSKILNKLDEIFEKTLAIKPEERYENPEELEKDLQTVGQYNEYYQKLLLEFFSQSSTHEATVVTQLPSSKREE